MTRHVVAAAKTLWQVRTITKHKPPQHCPATHANAGYEYLISSTTGAACSRPAGGAAGCTTAVQQQAQTKAKEAPKRTSRTTVRKK